MFKNLKLTRPLVVFDLEATGLNLDHDRIVEIGLVRHEGDSVTIRTLINPGIPIPAVASKLHGISNQDVLGIPKFAERCQEIFGWFDGADLCGYNIKRFDIPLLCAEFLRCGVTFPLAGRNILDVLEIFRQREQRTLEAAVKFYCGKAHAMAHNAIGDVNAAEDVLDAMLDRYADLPRDVAQLSKVVQGEFLDIGGNFTGTIGEPVFAFGKYRGYSLSDMANDNPGYLRWFLLQNFLEDAKAIVRRFV